MPLNESSGSSWLSKTAVFYSSVPRGRLLIWLPKYWEPLCDVLPGQWEERFGYQPLLSESFTDPEAYSGHGRVETRHLHPFAIEPLEADFPFARTLIVVRNCRTVKRTGQTTTQLHYYLSSVPPNHYPPVPSGSSSFGGIGLGWKFAITGAGMH